MIKFTAILKKFADQGEKTGWTYLEVPENIAAKLKPGNKQSFRVKGLLDEFPIEQVALMPMGDGGFIMPFNAGMRKGTGKRQGASVKVQLAVDEAAFKINEELLACLEDEPSALDFFKSLTAGHQRYFSNWIDSAKTTETRAKRIAQTVNAASRGLGYPEMIRAQKAEKDKYGK